MKLYYAPASCALAPHIAAIEAGVPLDLVKVDLRAHETEAGEDYYAINPRGYVPLLELDDGTRMTESSVLVQLIADKNPGANLLPASGIERYKVQSWLAFISTELHKGFGPLWDPTSPDETKASARKKLATRFEELERVLGRQQYIAGSTFTVADAYGFTVTNWTRFHNIDLAPYPNIQAWMTRVGQRPKVIEAMKQEGLM